MQSRKDIQILQEPKPVTRIDFGDHYPDGGWGWVVVTSAMIVYALGVGFHFAFGTIMVALVKWKGVDDVNASVKKWKGIDDDAGGKKWKGLDDDVDAGKLSGFKPRHLVSLVQ